jgi:anti-anti-sigma factor
VTTEGPGTGAATVYDCPPARVSVEDRGERVIFQIDGEIDLSNAEPLRVLALEHITRDHDHVALDLSAVQYLDSSSLRLITELAQSLRARRQRFVIVAPPTSVAHRLLTITGLADTFSVASEP